MYCVKCGKEGKLIEHLCKSCFLEKNIIIKVPKVIKVTICNLCYARLKKSHWEEVSSDADAIQESVKDNIWYHDRIQNPQLKFDLKQHKTNILRAIIDFKAELNGFVISDKLETEVRINYSTCGRCSRISGSYFEAIIQVRAMNRHLDNIELENAKKIVEMHISNASRTEKNAFLTKIELNHGGIDFYIGSSNLARQITRKLAKEVTGKIKESSSLVGRKEGKEVYRVTFLIRIPEYKINDFIKFNNHIYQVLSFQTKFVTCLDLNTGSKLKLKHSELASKSILGGNELSFDAVVVLETPNEVQVLDPENYKTVDLIKPKNFKVEGETVKIFKHGETCYLIPNIKI
jgi:nonsense-mediated mRNA decay protein 3